MTEPTAPALFLPKPSTPVDPDFRETLQGGHALVLEHAPGHALVIEYGDCEFWFSCQCSHRLPMPSRPSASFVAPMERLIGHTPDSGHPLVPHCQCGERLGRPFLADALNVHLDPALTRWEQHSMSLSTTGVQR
ncbi:hypothetical protein [Streptacidiphilus carbonis]|uniref:hypothetical protein n=1 Tax=Streptacidiphilus carbonis TaxID=105422 RepID=UPI0005A71ABE|nr:hypothetical protein [Streptacidiphilus carbonis]